MMNKTFSSSFSTAFAISFFCSNTSSKIIFGTLALITAHDDRDLISIKYIIQVPLELNKQHICSIESAMFR
jgi:hypothetical protein